MRATILAGGLGTRIFEETHLKPTPMIENKLNEEYLPADPIPARPLKHFQVCTEA